MVTLYRLSQEIKFKSEPIEGCDELRHVGLLLPSLWIGDGVDAVRQDEGAEGLREDEQVLLDDGRHDAAEEELEVLGHRILVRVGANPQTWELLFMIQLLEAELGRI